MTQARPNKHAPDTVRRSLRLPAKLVRQLDQYARTEGISANAATLRLLTDLLEDNPKADARFSVGKEFTGADGGAQYVARFCGEATGFAPTEFELATLFAIINARYEEQMPTVIISNLPPKSLPEALGERCVDRLREGGGIAVTFDWASERRAAKP